MTMARSLLRDAVRDAVRDAYRGAASVPASAPTTYLLRQSFTIGDTALANGNTITGPGGGGTHESSDSNDVGELLLDFNTSTWSIDTNFLHVTGSTGGLEDNVVLGEAITRDAGTVMRSQFQLQSTAGTYVNYFQLGYGTTRLPFYGNEIGMIYANNSSVSGAGSLRSIGRNPAGTAESAFVIGSFADAMSGTHEVAFVTGGFDSAGVPSASGKYGHITFVDLGDTGSWELLAVHTKLNTATMYPQIALYSSNAVVSYSRMGDIRLPDLTIPEVFTPSGYIKGTFSLADSTAITTSNALDAGTCTAIHGAPEAQDGGLSHPSGAEVGIYYEAPSSKFFASFTSISDTNGGGDERSFYYLRYVDSSNYFYVLKNQIPGGGSFRIWEVDTGSATLRADATPSGSPATTYNNAIRDDDSVIEAWFDGGNKISYTTSLFAGETTHRFGVRDNSGAGNTKVDNLYVLPLTSADYDTALDSF